jgi:TolA-binding protein
MSQYPNTQYVFDAINGIQYCYVAKDQPDNAISTIDIYIANNPNAKNADQVLFKKGEIYYSLESYAKAIQGYTELINTYPRSSLVSNAYFWIGKSSQMMKQLEDAEKSFKYVIDNHLNSEVGVSAVLELGKIYEDKNDFMSAVDLYSKTINAMPDSKRVPELLYFKGMAQKSGGELQFAYETFDEIITYYIQSIFAAKAKIELALLEIDRKDYANAEILLRELGENRTDDIGAQAQYYYGYSLFEQGKTTDAISALVRVRSVFAGYDEWYSKSLLKLGDCYVKLNDKSNARDMYRAVIKRHKSDELGREANQKLEKL